MLTTKDIKKSLIASAFLMLFVFLGFNYENLNTLATDEVSPPDFGSCTSASGNGDWVSIEDGYHHIPGQEANIQGSDDVYYLDGGDFLQCLCSVDGNGIETLWWRIDDLLTQEQVEKFIGEGWFFANGSEWNLIDTQYLAKNGSYNCAEPTPTPTVEPTPTPTLVPSVTPTPTAQPTPTVTPTPTPTEDDNTPRCTGLSASPSEGSSPLTVKFTGSGYDPNGPVLEYEFDFGDASGYQPQIWKTDESEAGHRYENPGSYIATLKVKDQGGRWRDGGDDCRIEIVVDGVPQVLSTSTTNELPKTGASGSIALALLAAGGVGRFLHKRFKLV